MDYDYAVIGAGLMGSAAARYLAESGGSVVVVGPDEPADTGAHMGVFSSHYDQARLTYQLSQDALWSYLGMASIRRYGEIERRSGIRFHWPVGRLTALPGHLLDEKLGFVREAAALYGVPLELYPAGDTGWRKRRPYLAFPPADFVALEPGPAGYVNPRLLVQAQLAIAQQQGATLIRQECHGVEETGDHAAIRLASGETVQAGKVLVASGAFSNFNQLLPERVPLRLKSETIILGEVSSTEARRLQGMPVVVNWHSDADISDIYMTPPVRYPDGHLYVKMGANTRADIWPESQAEVTEWFHGGPSDACLPALEAALRAMLPETAFESITSRRCIVCYTPSGAPTIDQVGESGRLFVAAGGNGAGAKGSDACGRLAAGLMLGWEWPAELARNPFTL